MNPELSTTMFRIFQESLTNIARHSLATKIDVTYIRNSGFLILIVKDNGKGLEKEKLDDFNSLGLIGIRERVRFWNGEVTFTGVPGCGTTIHVQVPLNTSGALFKS